MDENHCRVLGAYSRPGLEIELVHCRIAGVAAEALAEVVGRNPGPTNLIFCCIDNLILTNGLRGNSRLKSLTPSYSCNPSVGNQELLATASALRENGGLVDLNLRHGFSMSNETWGAICDSLKTHPTLQVVDLQENDIHEEPLAPPAVLEFRIQALLDMMNVNMSLHRIHLDDYYYSEHDLFVPYLAMNRLRSNVRATQKILIIPYRAKVLGRALLSARTDPNRF
jgi:hypothetical protein